MTRTVEEIARVLRKSHLLSYEYSRILSYSASLLQHDTINYTMLVSHDIVEDAERHHGRQTKKQHQLQPLRLDGPVYGLENLKLVEEPLGLLP